MIYREIAIISPYHKPRIALNYSEILFEFKEKFKPKLIASALLSSNGGYFQERELEGSINHALKVTMDIRELGDKQRSILSEAHFLITKLSKR